MRQLLTESVVLSLAGGACGVLFAYWITSLMISLMPGFYVPNEARIQVNGYVLVFCVIVSMFTGILSGLFPALQSSRPNADALKDESRGSSARSGEKVRGLLVIAEVAMCAVLVVNAALTMRSFIALQQVKLGFQPDQVMTVGLPLSQNRYTNAVQRNRFAREFLERVQNVPGVKAATIGNGGLPFGGLESGFTISGENNAENRTIMIQAISAGYLQTLQIPLREGRPLAELEINAARRFALINEAAAKLWPAGEDPVGKSIRLDQLAGRFAANTDLTNDPSVTVVGIIGNTRADDLRNEPPPTILVPYTLIAPPQRTLALRTPSDATAIMNALRAEVRQMDIEQPINGPTTFKEILGTRLAQPRFMMSLFGLFGGLALALALAGIYSVLSYSVSMRTREIGVRMAIGAQHEQIRNLVFGAGGKLVITGLIVGVVLAFGAARYLASKVSLYSTEAYDPLAYATTATLLAGVTVLACWLPAHRATRITPMDALRYE